MAPTRPASAEGKKESKYVCWLSLCLCVRQVHGKGAKTIVFTQTKRDADDVAESLSRSLGCEALHGDIAQAQRERTLQSFREGRFPVLVATDVAARGLDIPNVDLVRHLTAVKHVSCGLCAGLSFVHCAEGMGHAQR